MESGYLADTNTIIDYLENKLSEKALRLIDNLVLQFSVISRIELLAWKKATDEQINVLNAFIAASVVFDLSEAVILKSIEIRKMHRLKLPDAIIAATAVVNHLTLLTRNTNDFKNVSSLNCIDPFVWE